MRDIAVMILLCVGMAAAFRRPWHGVIALAVLSYLNPHTYAFGFSRSFPVYLVMFAAAAIAYVTARDRQAAPRDWRIAVFYLLWLYFALTTTLSRIPDIAAVKLIEVSKLYLPLFLTLYLINTREKLFWLLATIGFSFGLLAFKGGIFALGTGFNHRVWGPTGTQYGGNNEFAIATLMSIPLLMLVAREAPYRSLRLFASAAVPFCFISALSSWSRGALLTIFVLGLLILWHSRRKWLVAPIFAITVVVAPAVMPEAWFGRMNTIETYDEDASAMGRIRAWTDGINYAVDHPLTGSGFDGWIYVTLRDWHSSYVEVLAEHGFLAAGLWLSLLFGSILSLTRLGRLGRVRPDLAWIAHYAYSIRASLIAYSTGAIFLGITYWDLLYQLIFCAVLLKQFALAEVRTGSPARSPQAVVSTPSPMIGASGTAQPVTRQTAPERTVAPAATARTTGRGR